MYKNPLNNGDVSDYNSLKNQRNYSPIIKKYKKKLPTEPTELQKYYQYLTYQQPILDEAIYVAQRMKNEDINKQKDDYNFIEDLKIKREEEMKKKSQLEKDMNNVIRNDLFDASSIVKEEDPTPTITTDVELTIENIPQAAKIEMQNDLFDDNLSIAETVPKKEEIFELSRTEEPKKSKAKKKREGRKVKKAAAEEINKIIKEEDSALKIENAILGKVKRNRAKKELSALKENAAKTNEVIKKTIEPDMLYDPSFVPGKKRGRPKGSKKKPKN
jgi:hypothetical protein